MSKKASLFFLLVLLSLHLTVYSQSNILPTGTDTACVNGMFVFHKIYMGARDDIGYDIVSTSDSGYVIAGQTNSFGNGGYDGLLMKVNKKGNTVWSKAAGGSGNDAFYGIKRTSYNGFIAVGQTKSYGNAAGDAWLVKLDSSGNVQWSKKYGDGNVDGEVAWEVIQLSDGGYAFCGTHKFTPGNAEGFMVRTDSQGNVLWSKQYGAPGSDQIWGLLEDGNSIVTAGFYQGGSYYDSYLMKLDKSNGAIQLIKGYDGENRSTQFYRIRKNGSGYQVSSIVLDNFNVINQQQFIWNLNSDGTVQNVRKMVIPGINNIDFGWYPRADGGFISINGEYNSSSDLLISSVNPDGSLAWSKKYVRTGQQFMNMIIPSPEGGFTAVVPSLPGCVSFGKTLTDAKKMILDAIFGYLIYMKKRGEGMPKGDRDTFVSVVDLSSSIHA